MTTTSPTTLDRQTLLASIPAEWEQKFQEELSRSPLIKLVTLQVSQQFAEAYRQRVEQALQTGELQSLQSPYLKLKTGQGKQPIVTLTRLGDNHTPSPTTTTQVKQILDSLKFWQSSASYMWFDLLKLAFGEMEKDIEAETLQAMGQEEQLRTLCQYIFDEASDSLTSNFSTVLQVYLDQAVQLIINQCDLSHKTLQELEWLSGLSPKALPKSPSTSLDIFANGKTNNFATCKLLWESVNILTQRQDLSWQTDSDGKLAYTSTLKDGRGKLIFWVTDNPEEQYPEALAGEAALAVIETFDIRAACMHLIYAAHVTALNRPWEEEFIINDSQIAAYLGLDKRKDLSKEKRLKLIERISEQPAQILTFLHWPQQGSVESFYVEKSRLWEVAIGYHGQRDLFGDIKCTGLTIRCRAGMWAKYFLNKRGSDAGNAFYQYGVLSKNLLQTITSVWQHSEGAARMLAWLSFKARVSNNQVMLTTTLMDVAYGPQKVAAAQHQRDLRSHLANTWDNDLRVLCDAGWVVDFDAETYSPDIQPDWVETSSKKHKRPRGFWELLRNSRLRIAPPKEIADGIAKFQQRRRTFDVASRPAARKSSEPLDLSGSSIRAAREAMGWSQADLGSQVGKTKMWVSLIEREKRSIKPNDAEQLKQVLGL